MRVLIIENDMIFASYLQDGLQKSNYIVDIFDDPNIALYKALTNIYDCILIDTSVYNKKVLHTLRKLRGTLKEVPLLFLMSEEDPLLQRKLFFEGADDCILKPASVLSLVARIHKRISQYTRPKMKESKITFGSLELDIDGRKLTRNNVPIFLRNREFLLLQFMIHHPYKVMSRAYILQHVWSKFTDLLTNTVDVHMSELRKKIHIQGQKNLLHTVYGVGYVLSDREL